MAVCEELVLNVVATVNNLSFYAIGGTAVEEKQLAIADCEDHPFMFGSKSLFLR